MKRLLVGFAALAITLFLASELFAQEGGRSRGGFGGQGRGVRGGFGGQGGGGFGQGGLTQTNPLFQALDADKNGEISADELKNSAEALKKLDTNKDGKLTDEEVRPAFGGGFGRGGEGGFGRGGFGGGFGRGGDPKAIVERLKQADKDNDGKLSKDELPQNLQRFFDRADANKDNMLDQSEIQQLAEAAGRVLGRGGFGGRGGDGGGRPPLEGSGGRRNQRSSGGQNQ